jgi:hypothetical protein
MHALYACAYPIEPCGTSFWHFAAQFCCPAFFLASAAAGQAAKISKITADNIPTVANFMVMAYSPVYVAGNFYQQKVS